MPKHLFTLLAVISTLSIAGSQLAYASDDAKDEHYKVAEIISTSDAFDKLHANVKKITDIIGEQKEIDVVDLEDIHEVSYTLEAAIDKIRDDAALATDKVDAIDEAVQAVHFASEKHQSERTHEWADKLVALTSDIEPKMVMDPVKLPDFYTIVIKDHKFTPETVKVPAGMKVKLMIDNQDPTPEEFESHDLRREKIIGGNKKAAIFIGPLKPGKYHFFGEFNMDSANGYVIAE